MKLIKLKAPNTKIKLGEKVKDEVSGLTGIATCITEDLNGNIRISIEPKAKKDGTSIEGRDIDAAVVVRVGAGLSKKASKLHLETHVHLGDKVFDLATSLEGTALARHWFINGCLYYKVAAPVNKDGEIKYHYVDQQRLEAKAGSNILALSPQKATGGPSTAAVRQ